MIRGVLGLFAFAVALCAYIVMSPDAVDAPVSGTAEVTRSTIDDPLPVLNVAQTAPITTPAVIEAPAPDVPSEPAFAVSDEPLDQTASSILAGLGLDIAAPERDADDPLAQMTGDVLANIVAITGGQMPSAKPAPDTALEQLVVAALRDGTPDAQIDTIVNDAAQAGDLSVPRILVTSGGTVDTAVLLQAIITKAQMQAGRPAPAVPDVPTGDGTGVEVRVVQKATETEQYRFYTVNAGDSLGAIAIKFYGSVDRYPMIFEANRGILSSPDRIRVGQRLAIPQFPEV